MRKIFYSVCVKYFLHICSVCVSKTPSTYLVYVLKIARHTFCVCVLMMLSRLLLYERYLVYALKISSRYIVYALKIPLHTFRVQGGEDS